MKTVLITGGAGFIGSNFVRYIYDKYPDYRILVLDALTYAGSVQNLPPGAMESKRFEFWYGNVRDPSMVHKVVSQSHIIVHFAAESHVTRSIYDNLSFFETDVLGTQIVANSVLRYKDQIEKFIHISSSEVYGTAEGPKMGEDHPLNPTSPYAAAKAGADRLVYSYWYTYKIPAVIVRPFNNYGPRQHLEKLVPRFITSCILGEPLKAHGDGSAARDWLYVGDHCEGLDAIMNAPAEKVVGQVLNLGTEKHLTVLQVAEAIRELMNCKHVPIQYVGNRPGQVFRHTADGSKMKNLLGWSPKTDFYRGLEKTIEWYRQNEGFWRPQMWMRDIPIITAEGKREMH